MERWIMESLLETKTGLWLVVSGSGGIKDYSLIAEWAEMVAFEESLKVAKRLKKQNIIWEFDYANLVF
ncbi:hypothetical protein PVK06_005678 [Gossypium arboreum]|uniref:RNase H type-1 domain-containing protein n=1 Tax=Gossypium arboreum TaxID=29729 RepID=A0ABR0QW67_GOSAR|nr:hypothetical protein PVK06_005678 [Gossypium arboreum]